MLVFDSSTSAELRVRVSTTISAGFTCNASIALTNDSNSSAADKLTECSMPQNESRARTLSGRSSGKWCRTQTRRRRVRLRPSAEMKTTGRGCGLASVAWSLPRRQVARDRAAAGVAGGGAPAGLEGEWSRCRLLEPVGGRRADLHHGRYRGRSGRPHFLRQVGSCSAGSSGWSFVGTTAQRWCGLQTKQTV